ncbi:unnamed protein product [Allacma fusca]|uniref:Uncharacterized protein n=1 Tax=Allacma fusca TaxID=39272 RepID=A0A8J2NTJ9_9HEXA|nr:unnamed protein product [Allacma fusca]
MVKTFDIAVFQPMEDLNPFEPVNNLDKVWYLTLAVEMPCGFIGKGVSENPAHLSNFLKLPDIPAPNGDMLSNIQVTLLGDFNTEQVTVTRLGQFSSYDSLQRPITIGSSIICKPNTHFWLLKEKYLCTVVLVNYAEEQVDTEDSGYETDELGITWMQ